MRSIGSSSTAASVVLVGLTMEEMGRVRETLVGEAVLPSSPVGFGDAISSVQRNHPDVVIVSFSQGNDAPLAIAQALTREHPTATLVALADQSSAEVILSAMRVGYKEFVVLPGDGQRLRQVVKDAAYSVAEDEDAGMVVSFVGAKGGVGTTMLTGHVAAELAGIHRAVKDAAFSREKLAVLGSAVGDRWFTAQQVVQLLGAFDFEKDKVEAAVLLHPHVVDPENWFQVYGAFDFDANKRKVRERVGQ